ncbi:MULTISPECIES: ArsR/SmtB family transcription factor [unclassified Leifsonia]|uniref:ArsR/SmtB family transcription factor n=1 Tax=unclassified Leifsonia TaxID=2663824 RepID=UPI00036F6B55|nr:MULTISPECIES: helix-turn-helix domain-containing protein [unclassified Leifsonia]TDP99388.1 helix-turn-helix protein [Leifsonia sp. 115AMFTsu3.1]
MSFITGSEGNADADRARPERRTTVTDPRALRALAHPLRLALLDHLMSFGPRTASECAAVVGSTASNCSYHLRALAKVGLVEPVDAEDGRERPYRSSSTGLTFGRTEDPEFAIGANTVERALADRQVDDEAALVHRAIAQRDEQPIEWREASLLTGYALKLTPGELRELMQGLDALIRPYIALTRVDAPEGSDVVALHLNAFRHPDAIAAARTAGASAEQHDTDSEGGAS